MTGAYPVLHLGPVQPARPWARTYRGTPASVPEARRFVGELLAGCPARDALMICVSELCANAIAHTASGRGGVFTVEVDRPRDGVARVAVTDDGGASVPSAGSLDLMAEDGLMAEGGRGLAMVAACTGRWGFTETGPGRTVWAEATWPVAVPSPRRPAGPGGSGSHTGHGGPADPDELTSSIGPIGRIGPISTGRFSPRPAPPPDWPRGPAA
ncbi:MAG: ATP-binding protein [Actinobacteria bacterium]|nr:ATP-binding protein [Actinomycetota bacterium]